MTTWACATPNSPCGICPCTPWIGTPKEVALKLTNPSNLLWNWFEFVFRCQFTFERCNYIWIVGVTIWSGEVNIFYFLAKHHIILSGANSLGLISWDLLHWCNQHQKGVRSINLDIDILLVAISGTCALLITPCSIYVSVLRWPILYIKLVCLYCLAGSQGLIWNIGVVLLFIVFLCIETLDLCYWVAGFR